MIDEKMKIINEMIEKKLFFTGDQFLTELLKVYADENCKKVNFEFNLIL